MASAQSDTFTASPCDRLGGLKTMPTIALPFNFERNVGSDYFNCVLEDFVLDTTRTPPNVVAITHLGQVPRSYAYIEFNEDESLFDLFNDYGVLVGNIRMTLCMPCGGDRVNYAWLLSAWVAQ